MPRNLALVFWVSATLLSAQSLTTGTFLGVVTDPSGATVPQASVRVFNERTQFQRETTTDGEGNYTLLDIPTGDYRLEFEKGGFSKILRSGISLSAGHSLRVDCQLVLGSVADTVQ